MLRKVTCGSVFTVRFQHLSMWSSLVVSALLAVVESNQVNLLKDCPLELSCKQAGFVSTIFGNLFVLLLCLLASRRLLLLCWHIAAPCCF